MCCGVTVAFGGLKGFSSTEFRVVEGATARSIAPLRTSNRLRTSPVSAATFFVKSIKVGGESPSQF